MQAKQRRVAVAEKAARVAEAAAAKQAAKAARDVTNDRIMRAKGRLQTAFDRVCLRRSLCAWHEAAKVRQLGLPMPAQEQEPGLPCCLVRVGSTPVHMATLSAWQIATIEVAR